MYVYRLATKGGKPGRVIAPRRWGKVAGVDPVLIARTGAWLDLTTKGHKVSSRSSGQRRTRSEDVRRKCLIVESINEREKIDERV